MHSIRSLDLKDKHYVLMSNTVGQHNFYSFQGKLHRAHLIKTMTHSLGRFVQEGEAEHTSCLSAVL